MYVEGWERVGGCVSVGGRGMNSVLPLLMRMFNYSNVIVK